MSLKIEFIPPMNVAIDRERFLDLLAKSVDNASKAGMDFHSDFNGMPINGSSSETTDMFYVAWEDTKFMENRFWTSPSDGHIVLVRNPHDYNDLVNLALEKVWTPPQEYIHHRDLIMTHELAHWNAAMRNNIEAALGVKFLNVDGSPSFIPFLSLKPGQEVLVGALKEVLMAPDVPSTGDIDSFNNLNKLPILDDELIIVER